MIRVLIAGEELLVRVGLMAAVDWQSLGMTVVSCVGDGLQALGEARRMRPDLLIMDVVLPGLDGPSLLRALEEEGMRPAAILLAASPALLPGEQEREATATLCKATMTRQELFSALLSARLQLRAAVLREDGQAEGLSQACAALLAGVSLEADAPCAGAYLLCAATGGSRLTDEAGRTLGYLAGEALPGGGATGCAVRGGRLLVAFERALELPADQGMHALEELQRYAQRQLAMTMRVAALSCVPEGACAGECLSLLSRAAQREEAVWLGAQALKPMLSCEQVARFSAQCLRELAVLRAPERIYAAACALKALERADDLRAQSAALQALAGTLGAEQATIEGCQAALQACCSAQRGFRDELGAVVELLLGSLDREVSLGEAAARVGFHRVYFSTLFAEQMGRSYSRFCTALRMEHAKRLLRTEALPPAQVAERCGYRDLTYFYRVFRQHVGVTPSVWRGSAAG